MGKDREYTTPNIFDDEVNSISMEDLYSLMNKEMDEVDELISKLGRHALLLSLVQEILFELGNHLSEEEESSLEEDNEQIDALLQDLKRISFNQIIKQLQCNYQKACEKLELQQSLSHS